MALAVFAVMSCTMWGSSASALAAAPQIATDGAHATSATYASVSGNGDPNGLSTTLHADYALASELWCTSNGAEGAPHETGRHELGSGSEEISEILVELTGLTAASEYCAELVAESKGGITDGGQVRFTTPTPPSIDSESASQITASDATLEAKINPNGQETTYEFRLEDPSCLTLGPGLCESTGGKTIFTGSIPAGSADVSVSVDIASVRHELSANTVYGYSVVATNTASATAYGPETNTFTTLAAPSTPPSKEPPGTTTLPPSGTGQPAGASSGRSTGSGASAPLSTPSLKSLGFAAGKSTRPKAPTRAQKLSKALRVCKQKPKRRRALCEKLARRKAMKVSKAAAE
jgi:hypothetical protein